MNKKTQNRLPIQTSLRQYQDGATSPMPAKLLTGGVTSPTMAKPQQGGSNQSVPTKTQNGNASKPKR